MKIVIAGGSGFAGQKLTDTLLNEGHEIIILSRKDSKVDGNIKYVKWLQEGTYPENEIISADAFVNLAGVSINEGRWTAEHRKQIYASRMEATDELLRIISALQTKPAVLVNASAIGIYPASEDNVYTEESLDYADDFLGQTVTDWEKKAASVESEGIRVVFMRFGVILGKNGGALPLMVLPYKLFAGGTVGSGNQWVSWVHIEDVARAITFTIGNKSIDGPVNVTSPFPKRMKYFGKTIGSVLHRPHWIPVPSFVMKIVLGKKSALVLEGQHVLPEKLLNSGFTFHFPTLESALNDLYTKDV
ncbi:TIGR01777 family oxidoreductase [Sporosarcina sp. E16_8]|uniref:TIGR01777 family oxidoreductase n=1 Tax=Sporosarcina sp. E16_8 TaxID=2789295 RepID=UPI001A90DBBC|nr:TIGR01777 family oxidoreductase [Sporosarcina sp. E16_8]MBO0587918.1 TIGR01777 family protein [Sporosarcina sp. E16_8]